MYRASHASESDSVASARMDCLSTRRNSLKSESKIKGDQSAKDCLITTKTGARYVQIGDRRGSVPSQKEPELDFPTFYGNREFEKFTNHVSPAEEMRLPAIVSPRTY